VPQDFTVAATWYTAAAKQWKLSDHYPLGSTYAIGRGDKKNSSDAIRWFERAAALGVAEAQFDLGLAYEVGNGVQINLKKSIAWYQKAAAQGHDRATRALSRLHGTNRDNDLPVTMSEGTTATTGEPLNLQPPSPPADHEPKNVQTIQEKIHSDTKSLPGQVFMAHVASYRSIKQAKAGWDQLLVDHHMALQDAKMKISTITLPDEGLFYRVEVGPFLSLDKARALCSTLEARQTYCRPIERK
jgi:TPR repeat protein